MTTYVDAYISTRRNTGVIWGVLLITGAAYLGHQVITGGSMVRVIAAVAVMIALAIPAIEKPRRAVMGLFMILPFLGMVRHAFMSASGTARLDPLLLITSAVAIMILVSLLLNRELDFEGTALSKLVFLFLFVGLVQVFNPNQTSYLIGLTGIMINLIPVSFFFIGRSIADVEFTHKLIKIVLTVGAVAAAYGLVQVFIGFRGFELEWAKSGAGTAATVGETLRPFSFFNTASEWAGYAHISFVMAFAWFLFSPRTKRTFIMAIAGLIAYSGFLIGSRGFTVKVVLAIIVLMAARAKNRFLAAGVVVTLVSLVVFWTSTTSSDPAVRIQDRSAGASQLIEQQVRAIRDPFNRNVSTLPIHYDQASEAIREAVTHHPLGLGTGTSTRAGAKFGGLTASAELDIGDIFLSMGIFGGALYVLIILAAITVTSRVRRALPGPVWIGIWAMLITSIGAWLLGGNYAIPPLIWFLIGASDAAYKRMRDRGLLEGTLRA